MRPISHLSIQPLVNGMSDPHAHASLLTNPEGGSSLGHVPTK